MNRITPEMRLRMRRKRHFTDYIYPVAFVLCFALAVGFMVHAWRTAPEERRERNERFAQECVSQGGRVVLFEGYRPRCVFDNGEVFPE